MNSTSTSIFAVQSPDLVELRRTRSARGAGTGVRASWLVCRCPCQSRRRAVSCAVCSWRARPEKGGHGLQRCAQRPGMRLSCYGSCRTSRPSARHVGTFPLWPGRPCASSARSALRSARVTCPRPSSPRRAQPKCGETVGFSAFAHSEDRAQCARHFALLRPLKPKLHRKFSSDQVFFSGTPVP